MDEEFEAALAAVVREAQGSTARAAAAASAASHVTDPRAEPTAEGMVAFRVVLRKGGREDRSHEVSIPASSGLAAAVQAEAAAEEHERALMKRLVLEASAREETEQVGQVGKGRGRRLVVSYGGGRGGASSSRETNPPRL